MYKLYGVFAQEKEKNKNKTAIDKSQDIKKRQKNMKGTLFYPYP